MKDQVTQDSIRAALFDEIKFSNQLPLTEANSLYKDTLIQAQKYLDLKFHEGAPIRLLIFGRAWLVDQLLAHAWQRLELSDKETISLIAVGGYGRGELHPHSDIDLLVLHKGRALRKYQEKISTFLTFLWDIGLQVGHSVRSVKECRDQAKGDITIATSMMESRTIAGHPQLIEQMEKLVGPNKIWAAPAFFQAKREEQLARHEKFNDTEYNLEPNVKGIPGGLRDIQTIGWVTKRHFDSGKLDDLVKYEFLTDVEFDLLSDAQDFLWKIRYGLHMLAGRGENRLLFDYQRTLAELFGYTDNAQALAIEQLMQEFYIIVLRTRQLNDMLLQHFDEAILQAHRTPKITKINSRFNLVNGYIEVARPDIFKRSPFALMEIFVLIAQQPDIVGVRASTIRLLYDHRYLIDDKFREDIRNTSLFMELLSSPNGLVTQLQRMRRYGILGRYLPEFGSIIGKMQHDLFHIYTVDAHTLILIRYLRRIFLQKEEIIAKFPLASEVIKQIPKIELLYVAGLYHDIAKGRGGDHSELGKVDARAFCKRHRLNKWDEDLVAWLVEQHLVMSMFAQKRDLSDPEVIQEFAELVQNQLRLDYLFLLTVADINATNPKLWNSWRATLMRNLYMETKRAIARGLDNPLDKEITLARTQNEALELLPFNPLIISTLWHQLGDDYFLQHSVDDITWHTKAILQHTQPNEPLILIRELVWDEQVGGTQIFIYSLSSGDLFTRIASVLEQLELNIVDARISTSRENFSLNSYVVLDSLDNSIDEDDQRIKVIHDALFSGLTNTKLTINDDYSKHTNRRLKHFAMPTQVTIFNDQSQGATIIEVTTPDRPGLLARIGKIFLEHQLMLRKAKIATLGERVEDVFFVTNLELQPIEDSQLLAKVQQEICAQLDDYEAQSTSKPVASGIEI